MNMQATRQVTVYDRAFEGVVISYAQKHQLDASSPAFADEVRVAMAEDIINISSLLAKRYNLTVEKILEGLPHAIQNAAKTLNISKGSVRDLCVSHALAAAETALGDVKGRF